MIKNVPAAELASLYRNTLLHDVAPFWIKHSLDNTHGGYFTCLDRSGKIYDTDKFSWLQARQIYMFARLHNAVDHNQQWLDIATSGINFLDKYGRDDHGNYYFSLTREGKPLTKAFNIFSDCFAALAYHEYAKATASEQAMVKAKEAFDHFLDRRNNPKGTLEKTTGNRPLRNFGISMMTAYLAFQMETVIGRASAEKLYDECILNIFDEHYDESKGIIREYVDLHGNFLDTYEGRLINPGHGIEAMWFLMDVAVRLNRKDLIDRSVDICLQILNYSWDQAHGGIYYFMDAKGAPPQQLEHDQKLWWVHLEALIALSRAWLLTDRRDVMEWYHKVHHYTWQHFPDPEHGEWYGYLSREGKPHLDLKGGKWKGFFHVPRALLECANNFDQIKDRLLPRNLPSLL